MVIRKVGKVTEALHTLKPGDTVGIRGPFGTSFPMDKCKAKTSCLSREASAWSA